MESVHVKLSAEGCTSEELFTEWQRLCALRSLADRLVEQSRVRWQDATDPAEKEQLGLIYDGLWPEYEVLSAWTELVYSAWVFSREGCRSVFIDEAYGRESAFMT